LQTLQTKTRKKSLCVTSGKTFFTIIFIFSASFLTFMKKSFLAIFAIFAIGIAVLLIALFLLPKGEKNAVEACIALCKSELEKGRDLSSGPCLSNEIAPNWVCDVAHWPRQSVDNKEENQCEAYRKGLASHFVEVDVNCKLIRAV
jgi:hypothetical protein